MSNEIEALKFIYNELKKNRNINIEKVKSKAAREFKLSKMPTNADILTVIPEDEKNNFTDLLKIKPVRSLSGVCIIAVMLKPWPCPHGICICCPKGENAPQSYTGEEPAALRAQHNEFDPYKQVKNRIAQLDAIGHITDKCELIVMGGTFTSHTLDYQEWFVRRCFDAFNSKNSILIEEAHKLNEQSKHRCVGLTFETRPDWCKPHHIDRMLTCGCTRVELGVQTTYDYVYAAMNRGHRISDVIDATQNLRDAGIKINYHMMPGLPKTTKEQDFSNFKHIFSKEIFQPDMVKIYPTLVVKGTELYSLYEKGEYSPPSLDYMLDLIVKIKKIMPPWVRTMRIQRDIPAFQIIAGIKKSNLGELVYNKLVEEDVQCKCIRCREVGHKFLKEGLSPQDTSFVYRTYKAGQGTEHFISMEDVDQDILLGYIRLRFPSKHAHRDEINEKAALIRELHVYGPVKSLKRDVSRINKEHLVQHTGLGSNLLEKAENIAQKHKYKQMLIMSGVGVRDYYKKRGYEQYGPYMRKKLE